MAFLLKYLSIMENVIDRTIGNGASGVHSEELRIFQIYFPTNNSHIATHVKYYGVMCSTIVVNVEM